MCEVGRMVKIDRVLHRASLGRPHEKMALHENRALFVPLGSGLRPADDLATRGAIGSGGLRRAGYCAH